MGAASAIILGCVVTSYCLWFYSSRYVGELSLLLPHKRVARFSTLDFWGNRQVCASVGGKGRWRRLKVEVGGVGCGWTMLPAQPRARHCVFSAVLLTKVEPLAPHCCQTPVQDVDVPLERLDPPFRGRSVAEVRSIASSTLMPLEVGLGKELAMHIQKQGLRLSVMRCQGRWYGGTRTGLLRHAHVRCPSAPSFFFPRRCAATANTTSQCAMASCFRRT